MLPELLNSMQNDIKNEKGLDTIISRDVLITFMNSFYHKNRMMCKQITYGEQQYSQQFREILSLPNENEEDFIAAAHNYLLTGNYAVTLRKNIIYFMKRSLFKKIGDLGVTYGTHIMNNNQYWFNAESQLEQICIENGIDIFETESHLEGESLYSYHENNYFENNELKKTPNCLFFIKRH